MLQKINELIKKYQSKELFFKRLRFYFLTGSTGYNLIEKAYDETMRDFGDNKIERDALYHVHLRNAPRRAIMIKLADRLHNIMTLWAHDVEKQRRKIQETRLFYLPLAEQHTILIHEIESAMKKVEKSWEK